MIMLKDRTYGPTHLTLDECRESHRPTIVQALAQHVSELKLENQQLQQRLSQMPGGQLLTNQPGAQPDSAEAGGER